jgi:hypothetical protein
MRAKTFDGKFDAGEKVTDQLELSKARRINTPVRWTVRVSKDTDAAVRSFLARRGMKKGDLAKFVEEAVRWRVLDQTLAQIKTRNVKSGGRADRRRLS